MASIIRRATRYVHRMSYEEPWLLATAVFAGVGVLVPLIVYPYRKDKHNVFQRDYRISIFDIVRASYPSPSSSYKMPITSPSPQYIIRADRRITTFIDPDSIQPEVWEEWTSDIRWRLKKREKHELKDHAPVILTPATYLVS